MRLGYWVVLAAALTACSANTTMPPDSLSDAQQMSDAAPDIELDIAADAAMDTAKLPDAVADDLSTNPDPNKVSEELNHPNCLPDGPYQVHRSEQVRDEILAAASDLAAVAAAGGTVIAGGSQGLMGSVGDAPPAALSLADFPAAKVRFIVPGPDTGNGDAWMIGGSVGGGGAVWFLGSTLTVASVDPLPEPVELGVTCEGLVFAKVGSHLMMGPGMWGDVSLPPGDDLVALVCGGDHLVAATSTEVWKSWWKADGDLAWDKVIAVADGKLVTIAQQGEILWLATTEAVHKTVGGSIETSWLAAPGGLPYDHFTALAPSPDGKKLAIGHEIGVTILDQQSGATDYFHSKRWLPGEEVRDLSWDADGALWVATNEGLARLWNEEIYLQDKADLLLTKMEDWFFRLDGFLTAGAQFDDPWVDDTEFLWDDDNDGQWTEEGIGAMCYAYATTGDERYYLAARRCVENMMLLIDIPAVSFEEVGANRGFISRSVVRDDETACFADKVTQDNWHLVHWSDGHDYYWKDDTSSDELTGHFYGLPIYYDLCAKDDAERSEIAEHVQVAADYLLDNGYTLPDLDGEPTTHGDWTPARLTRALDGLQACMDNGHELVDCIDSWGGGAFLDSVEILSFMAAAWHVTGELRFLESFEYLAGPARVGESAMFTENVATWTGRGTTNYCDHELADLAFLALLRYDPDEARRQQWIDSLLAAWQWEIGERNPLKALSMAAFIAQSEGLAEGIQSLVEYPDDLRMWLVDNSHRQDALPDVNDRHGDPQFKIALPYDELPILRWDHNPYGMKGGNSGKNRMSPAFWLLPYWGLRYHGAICSE